LFLEHRFLDRLGPRAHLFIGEHRERSRLAGPVTRLTAALQDGRDIPGESRCGSMRQRTDGGAHADYPERHPSHKFACLRTYHFLHEAIAYPRIGALPPACVARLLHAQFGSLFSIRSEIRVRVFDAIQRVVIEVGALSGDRDRLRGANAALPGAGLPITGESRGYVRRQRDQSQIVAAVQRQLDDAFILDHGTPVAFSVTNKAASALTSMDSLTCPTWSSKSTRAANCT